MITPVHNPRAEDLRTMLESVRNQAFGDFEHCIVDDGSTASHVAPMLQAAAAGDARVRVHVRTEQGGIVAATNDALEMAQGEFLAFVDHDDALHVDALAEVDRVIGEDVDYVYTDEDKIDANGRHCEPFLKPDWSPERLRTQMYTCHLSVARRTLVDDIGRLRIGLDGAQDWDLMLRVTERARRILHVPRILYHWRAVPTSVAGDIDAKPWAYEAGQRAVADHLERTGVQAEVEQLRGRPGSFRLRPCLRDEPLVSIVIPTGGFRREVYGDNVNLVVNTVRSIRERSTYQNLEFVVVVDEGVTPDTRDELMQWDARLVPFARPFSFSQKINVGAIHAWGEYLLFLNDDVEVLPEDWRDTWPRLEGTSAWIESMLLYALDQGVGAVGAKMYFGDTRLQHVGLVCTGPGPSHVFRGFGRDFPGYFNNALLPGNYLALTGACLLTRRDAFEAVGGLCPQLPINFNDVDYCFKLHRAGYRNVFTPDAELLHFESSSRKAHVLEPEFNFLWRRWRPLLEHDPYYNPQFVPGPHFIVPTYLGSGVFASTG